MVVPKVLGGKLRHGDVDVQVKQGVAEGALGIVTAVPGGAGRRGPPRDRPGALPPLVPPRKKETVVVGARRWLGGILGEQTRAPPNGAKQPTWWTSVAGEENGNIISFKIIYFYSQDFK